MGGGTVYYAARRGSFSPEVAVPKNPSIPRVFMVGESVARLFGSNGEPVAGDAEFINAGMPAYNSRRILGVVNEISRMQPDTVIVMSGNNDTPSLEPCPDFLTSMKMRLFRLTGEYRHAPKYVREALLARKLYEDNLDKMADSIKRGGARAVFCTLPANLSSMGPSSVVPLHVRPMAEGMVLFERGSFAQSRRKFEEAAAARPELETVAWYFAARAADAMGDHAGARRMFRLSADTDYYGPRTTTWRNEAVRRVARRHGAALADLEADLDARLDGKVPDLSIFYDGVHWHWEFNRYFGAVIRSVSDMRFSGGDRETAAAFRQAMSGRDLKQKLPVEFVSVLEYCAMSGLDMRIPESALSRLDYIAAADPALLSGTLLSREKAEAYLRYAINRERMPGRNYLVERFDELWPAWLLCAGEFYRRKGDLKTASVIFGQVLAERPDSGQAHLMRGWTKALAGDVRGAEADFSACGPELNVAASNLRALLLEGKK